MPAPKVQFLPLTSMRCFLALWVVIFHQTSPAGYLGPSLAQLPIILFCLLRTGYVAVDLFFVLSGFVLAFNYSLAQPWSSTQMTRFAVARFARIYPAYCLGLILSAPFVVYSIADNLSLVTLREQTLEAVLNWTLLQAWFPKFAVSWNSPGWSLSNEAFFYFCFPFVGVLLWKISSLPRLIVAVLVFWLAALIAPLVAAAIPLHGFGDVPATSLHPLANPIWANFIKFNPLLRLPDFCIGILLCRVYRELSMKNSLLFGRGYYLYVPGILFELLAIANCNSIPYPLVHNGLLLPFHSLVILGFALGGGSLARLLSVRPLIFLGNASYAMYILHSPIASCLHALGKRLKFLQLDGASGVVLYVLLVICLSAIVFRFVEEPANRVVRKKLLTKFDASPQSQAITVRVGS